MKLNEAQTLNAAWIGLDPDFYTPDRAKIASEQTANVSSRYKAAHAMRGTPHRLHYPRVSKLRLFNGHRP